jgi:1,4-alpha-glucan branching enzyme
LWAADANPGSHEWVDADDAARNVFSFIRRAPGSAELACVANFSGQPHQSFRLALPAVGRWEEVLNTDAESYTGSGLGNLGAVTAVEGEHGGLQHGRPAYADIVVPALATIWLRRTR